MARASGFLAVRRCRIARGSRRASLRPPRRREADPALLSVVSCRNWASPLKAPRAFSRGPARARRTSEALFTSRRACNLAAPRRRGSTGCALRSSRAAGSPSSRGPGHRPFTAVTGVRIPLGTPINQRLTLYHPVYVHQLSNKTARLGSLSGVLGAAHHGLDLRGGTRVTFRFEHGRTLVR